MLSPAVRNGGDPDSTSAICGNILGPCTPSRLRHLISRRLSKGAKPWSASWLNATAYCRRVQAVHHGSLPTVLGLRPGGEHIIDDIMPALMDVIRKCALS